MKNRLLAICLFALVFISCEQAKNVTVRVANPIAADRTGEMVEVPMSEVSAKLQMAPSEQIVILNADGKKVPYQITYDEKVIFRADVPADSASVYTIRIGEPDIVPVVACGRHYPERVDDIAWENDLVAFRAYGPALQKTGERAFGYDVWTKRETASPVVEARYAMELDPETLAQIDSLKKADPKAAAALRAATSYHVDHGNGLDCYKVGPTLGGGTAALMADGKIVYPYCYKDYEILDNGPLRFTLKLVYHPLTVKSDENVVETRVISLDAGSQLNKTIVTYSGLSEETDIATGIVLHHPEGKAMLVGNAASGFISYADPTDNPAGGNGEIYVGAVFPAVVKEARPVFFSKEEKEKERGGADGHVLAISDYRPGSEYTYYWGAAWSKANMKNAASWNKYLKGYAQKVRNPLTVTIQ